MWIILSFLFNFTVLLRKFILRGLLDREISKAMSIGMSVLLFIWLILGMKCIVYYYNSKLFALDYGQDPVLFLCEVIYLYWFLVVFVLFLRLFCKSLKNKGFLDRNSLRGNRYQLSFTLFYVILIGAQVMNS